MFLSIILISHNIIRWLVLLFFVMALVRLVSGIIKKRGWTDRDLKSVRKFSLWMTIQFLLGVVLYFYPNGIVQISLTHFSMEEIISNKDRMFFVLFHPVMMVVAVALSHITSIVTRKINGDRKKFLIGAVLLILISFIIIGGIPWQRPLFRLF